VFIHAPLEVRVTAGFAPLGPDDPRTVSGYELRARLGEGGMGRVYLAFSPGGRPLAIKVLRPEYADNEEFRSRFRQEIAAAQRVQSLHTAPVVDADPEAPAPWLATAHIAGPSLQRAVAEHGPLPLPTVFQLLAGVAEGLAAVHASGLIHRDLKPANVLLADDGPRVIDFGIARAAEATSLTRTGMRVGTPRFMAPEQILGGPATPAIDVFALGNLAYFAATGRTAFGDGDEQALFYRIENKPANLDGCPPELRAIVERCLAKDPGDRPSLTEIMAYARERTGGPTLPGTGSWLPDDIATSLTAYATTVFRPARPPEPTAVATTPIAPPPRRNTRRGAVLIGIAAVAVLAAVVALVRFGTDGTPTDSATPVTIVVDTFGTSSGYAEAIRKWNAAHTDITIKERLGGDVTTYWSETAERLRSGSGAGDVTAVEDSDIGLAAAHPEWWTDLSEYGLGDRRDDYSAYKWQAGVAADGTLFGLGTDVGGMGICYRIDLFEQAGLPTDRDQVAALWPTWNDFVDVGRQFRARVPDVGWIDGTTMLYTTVLAQEAAKNGDVTYFDEQDRLIVESNPAVRDAFDVAKAVTENGLTAGRPFLGSDWDRNASATVGCPAWMLTDLSSELGEGERGNWDIAPVPGEAGNIGGSWLAVPAQSAHPKEAAMVADYLTSAEVEADLFASRGTLPSNVEAQRAPEVRDAVNAYFNDAPVGAIYPRSVASLQPVFLGTHHDEVRAAVEATIVNLDNGSLPPERAWETLVGEAEKAAG
jgi:cellobiose transport system substrate-binding protein